MKIGIDVSAAQRGPSGTGRYIEGLVAALLNHDDGHHYVLFTRKGAHSWRSTDDGRIRVVEVRAPLTNLRQHIALPLAIRRERLDIYHSPAFFLPWILRLVWRGPSIVGIFDLNFLKLKENWRGGRRAMYASLAVQVPIAAHQATRIVTLSEVSAQDIVALLKVKRTKISVIPAACQDLFLRPPVSTTVQDLASRHGRFFLSAGIVAPQKNVERILRAFADVRDKETTLVIVGRSAGTYEHRVLRPLQEALGLKRRVVFVGSVSDTDLRAYYAAAACLVFPSLAEGFGLPILEAMACGCPVITSTISSMPEVAGDAALLVDPYDVSALASAMDRVLDDGELRAGLVEAGRTRAALFTWDSVAQQMVTLYESVSAGRLD